MSNKFRIQGIIFDLDGTLVDSRQDLATAINAMRAEYGRPALGLDVVTSHVGDGARTLVARCLAGTAIDPDDALPRFKRHYALHLFDVTTCYPGVREMLEACAAAHVRCAVVTNKPEAATREILRRASIAPHFAPVFGGDSLEWHKPDPRIMHAVLDQWGIGAAEAVVVGDHDTDIAAAHGAGMKAVFLKSGFGRIREEQPDWIVSDMDEARRILLAR